MKSGTQIYFLTNKNIFIQVIPSIYSGEIF